MNKIDEIKNEILEQLSSIGIYRKRIDELTKQVDSMRFDIEIYNKQINGSKENIRDCNKIIDELNIKLIQIKKGDVL